MVKLRLCKALADAGITSRRGSVEFVETGRVQVNGETVENPYILVDWKEDTISVDGERLTPEARKVYFLLNKPAGYICSARRVGKRDKLVYDLLPNKYPRLFTVGRLDKETEGLIIITNDGDFANRAMHPSSKITREYLAKTDQEITHEHLQTLMKGAMVEGTWIRPASIRKVRRGTVKVTVREGKKREVRILLQTAGLKVISLTRIRFGGLILGKLPLGTFRPLGDKECKAIFQ